MTVHRFPDVPPGSHWGHQDADGVRWTHHPHQGWRKSSPRRFFFKSIKPWWRFW